MWRIHWKTIHLRNDCYIQNPRGCDFALATWKQKKKNCATFLALSQLKQSCLVPRTSLRRNETYFDLAVCFDLFGRSSKKGGLKKAIFVPFRRSVWLIFEYLEAPLLNASNINLRIDTKTIIAKNFSSLRIIDLRCMHRIECLGNGTNHKQHQESVSSHHCDLTWT